MVAAATAEPEITALIAVFNIPAACSLVAGARSSVTFGNMLELTLEGTRPAPLAPMPLQVLPVRQRLMNSRSAWNSASSCFGHWRAGDLGSDDGDQRAGDAE